MSVHPWQAQLRKAEPPARRYDVYPDSLWCNCCRSEDAAADDSMVIPPPEDFECALHFT